MVIVIDFQGVYITPFLTQMISIKNFIIGFIALLMLCFIMTLANHQTMLNSAVAYDHAHMLAIGFSYKQLIKDALKVESMIFGMVAVVSAITYVMIFYQIEGLFATFGAFETVDFNILAIVIGLFINVILFYVMFFVKTIGEKKLNIVDYLKIF